MAFLKKQLSLNEAVGLGWDGPDAEKQKMAMVKPRDAPLSLQKEAIP